MGRCSQAFAAHFDPPSHDRGDGQGQIVASFGSHPARVSDGGGGG